MTDRDHTELFLCMGVAKTPGDTESAERGLETLDLLSGVRGFAVEAGGWIPKRAQGKSGLWADIPLTDGRSPVAEADANVVESMTLSCAAATLQNRDWMLAQLERFRLAARDFWAGISIEPVFLHWWAVGAPGPQYAIIKKMDVDDSASRLEGAQVTTIRVTIERESYWHGGVPIGGSPKSWTYEAAGDPFTFTNASLVAGTDHLVYGTIKNKQEFDTSYDFLSRNFIDIPADKIPGDAPALVCISATKNDTKSIHVMIANTTNRASIVDRDGDEQRLYNVFACSGSSVSLGSLTTDANLGVVHQPKDANPKILSYTPADAFENQVCLWNTNLNNYSHLNPVILRGTYMVFLRGHQVGGAFGNTKLRLTMTASGGVSAFFDSGQIPAQLLQGTGPHLHYMGTMSLPLTDHSMAGGRGRGLFVEDTFQVKLLVQRTTGTSAMVLVDVVLLPIQEGCVQITTPYFSDTLPVYAIYDNTGYLLHGKPESVGTIRMIPATGDNEFVPMAELSGHDITLTPGVNNRLYFLFISQELGYTKSVPVDAWGVFANIVPRWLGVRDA